MKFIKTLIEKYKASKKHAVDLEKFKNELLHAVSDGKLTEEEIHLLDKIRVNIGISEKEFDTLKINVYLSAFKATIEDRQITTSEEDELIKIQKYLNVEDITLKATEKDLARFRLLAEINQGNLPNLQISNIVKQKNEKVYWVEPATLLEEKIISRRYEGGSHGVSFRIVKGVSYRVGASKGHLISDTGIVSMGTGEFIITSKRVIFRGNGKSFAFKLDKILDTQLFTNAIYLTEANKAKPRMVKFTQEGSHEIIGAILSHSINNYE